MEATLKLSSVSSSKRRKEEATHHIQVRIPRHVHGIEADPAAGNSWQRDIKLRGAAPGQGGVHQGKIREARETAAMGRAQASTSNQGGSACLPSHVHASPAMQAALAHMDLQLLPPRRVHCELVCGPHPQK